MIMLSFERLKAILQSNVGGVSETFKDFPDPLFCIFNKIWYYFTSFTKTNLELSLIMYGYPAQQAPAAYGNYSAYPNSTYTQQPTAPGIVGSMPTPTSYR